MFINLQHQHKSFSGCAITQHCSAEFMGVRKIAVLIWTLQQFTEVFTLFSVREMHVRKMKMAIKRLMQRCRWMVVLGLLIERIKENVRMQRNRQNSERDRPTQVMSCNSNLSCWERSVIVKAKETDWSLNYKIKQCTVLTSMSRSAMSTAKLLRWLQEHTVRSALDSTTLQPLGDHVPPYIEEFQNTQVWLHSFDWKPQNI